MDSEELFLCLESAKQQDTGSCEEAVFCWIYLCFVSHDAEPQHISETILCSAAALCVPFPSVEVLEESESAGCSLRSDRGVLHSARAG